MDESAMYGDDPRPADVLASDAPDQPGGGGLAPGLVPVAWSFARRRVRLLDLRGIDGREQSFRHTVARWLREQPHRASVEMTWSGFLAAARLTPRTPPAGFVFNVARCGSTLLANMLDAPDGHLTLKESSTIGVLLRALVSASPGERRQELEALLTVTVPLFSRLAEPPAAGPGDQSAATVASAARSTKPRRSPAGPTAARLFVKPHSLSTDAAAALLRLFPATPAIFLYREPGAVVASMLAAAPYGGLYDRPRAEQVAMFPMLASIPAGLSPAAYDAYLWRAPVEAALALPPGRLLFLDYAELVGQPAAVVERLVQHLGLDRSAEMAARMAGALGVYAKDASGQVPFDRAGTHRRPPLTAAQRAEVSLVTDDLFAQVAARRRAQR